MFTASPHLPQSEQKVSKSSFKTKQSLTYLVVLEFCDVCHHQWLHKLHPVFAVDVGLTEKNKKSVIKSLTAAVSWRVGWWIKTTARHYYTFLLCHDVTNTYISSLDTHIAWRRGHTLLPIFTAEYLRKSQIQVAMLYLKSAPMFKNTCLTCNMWLTSKMEQCSLVCMWEAMWLSLYWTGILQPANSTIFPSCPLWKSNSGVFFKAVWGKENIRLVVKVHRWNTVTAEFLHAIKSIKVFLKGLVV